MAALYAGGLLARRYRLIDQIGAGGMSVIWRARDEVLDRVIAIKVLAASLAADAKFRDMVREEARAAAQLVHPHVTAVHDYGEEIAPDGAVTAFVVMELLTGEELEARLRDGPLPWADSVEICAQVAEALAEAHELGIVHRDITPSNIMMTSVGAKVLDFGIATHVGAPDEDEDGETFGTPAYVAPERLDGTPAQPATDTYSLGVLLYETLTGQVPYPAETWDELTEALRTGGPVPPLTGVPGLPPKVADACLRCLARDPVDRPTTREVAELLRGQLLAAEPPAPAEAAPPSGRPAIVAEPSPSPAAPIPPAWSHERTAIGVRVLPALAEPAGSGPGAPAATPVRQPEQHARRSRIGTLGLACGAVAVVGLAVIVGLLVSDPRQPRPVGLPTAPMPATSAPAPSTNGSTPPTNGSTPPGTRSAAPIGPTPTGPVVVTAATFREAVAELDRLIGNGLAAGAIRGDVGVDLRNQLRNLQMSMISGPVDLVGPVDLLRQAVATRVHEGGISRDYARQLDAVLAQLTAT
ncbi:serine/threonine protein kinase [Micromonospora pisi]|uniref:non-specific serine/threonine protein kinase n=1 Tax=Micromonospora pisi TaxID=589240 RepID=A0A495JH21_9ACTN|nr:serine/threonine-protein kinase [Micromonospora pisi]RKR88197.1 serine/threonine protein kinase [Micromonospora pisi]